VSSPYVTVPPTLTTQQLPQECLHRNRLVVTTLEDLANQVNVYLCTDCEAWPIREEWKP
jgi:hypothetical protein